MRKESIKETLELLKAIELIVSKGLEIYKDGINTSDIPKVLDLFKEYEKIEAGVKGLAKVDDELKDLDATEVTQLTAEVFAAFQRIKAIIAVKE